jgi:hypothetical protein
VDYATLIHLIIHRLSALRVFEDRLLSRRYGLEGHVHRAGLDNGEIQFFKTNDSPRFVLHQEHLITRFFTDVFIMWIIKPDRQRIAGLVVKYCSVNWQKDLY